jgi:hypothetical protein
MHVRILTDVVGTAALATVTNFTISRLVVVLDFDVLRKECISVAKDLMVTNTPGRSEHLWRTSRSLKQQSWHFACLFSHSCLDQDKTKSPIMKMTRQYRAIVIGESRRTRPGPRLLAGAAFPAGAGPASAEATRAKRRTTDRTKDRMVELGPIRRIEEASGGGNEEKGRLCGELEKPYIYLDTRLSVSRSKAAVRVGADNG